MPQLNIGSDIFHIPGFINIDIRREVRPNIVTDILLMGIRDQCVEVINLGNILEHLSTEDIPRALIECHRVLHPNGILYVTVPLVDLARNCLVRGDINQKRFDLIVRGEESGYNSHRTTFEMGSLESLLAQTGFKTKILNLKTFPYLVVSDIKNPQPDPWQYGVEASKI